MEKQKWYFCRAFDFVAQLVEQLTLNQWVEGSSPSEVTTEKTLFSSTYVIHNKRKCFFYAKIPHIPKLLFFNNFSIFFYFFLIFTTEKTFSKTFSFIW